MPARPSASWAGPRSRRSRTWSPRWCASTSSVCEPASRSPRTTSSRLLRGQAVARDQAEVGVQAALGEHPLEERALRRPVREQLDSAELRLEQLHEGLLVDALAYDVVLDEVRRLGVRVRPPQAPHARRQTAPERTLAESPDVIGAAADDVRHARATGVVHRVL